jgi:hypothetical protein
MMQKIGSKLEPFMPMKDKIFNDKHKGSFAKPPSALDSSNAINVATVQDVNAITDVSYDLSSTSDISQVTTTGEVVMVHHNLVLLHFLLHHLVSPPIPISIVR